MKSYIYYAFISFFWTSIVGAQNNPELLQLDVVQDESIVFYLENDFGSPTIHFTQSKGIVEIEPISNGLFEITYTADSDGLGMDIFSLKTTHFQGFFPSTELTVVNVAILKSRTKAEDDFVLITGNETIEIAPLENDYTEGQALSLSITQVMYGEIIETDSNTVIYTPSSEDIDYINYVATDEHGASQQATIFVKKQNDLLDFVSKQYTISNTQSQYFFMESDEFSISTGLYLGDLEQVNSRVFRYTPHADVVGNESITLEDNATHKVEIDINILGSTIDDGILKDDIVYTTVNNEILFNVYANDYDNTLNIVESETDEELEYLGNGIFAYEPPNGYSGVKTYSYTATNGFIQEEANIDIVISNFLPASESTYSFEVYESSVLTIPYDVPLDDFYFEIASDPTFGNLSYINNNETVITTCGDIVDQKTILYTPFVGYEGVDEFDILYCPDNAINPCQLVKTTINVVANTDQNCNCVEDCVWNGDTNNDGLVDILDILAIGRNLGAIGSTRNTSANWSASSCDDWNYNDAYGINTKHSDTNGDGIVKIDDITAVTDNYGKIHSYASNNSLSVKDFPFYLIPQSTDVEVGEKMYIDIILGTESNPVIDLEGVAFGINLSAYIVDSSSVKITYPHNGYFVQQAPYFDLTHQPKDGTIHTAAIKTNGSTSNGHGLLATLEFIVEEDIEGVKTPNKTRSSNGDTVYDEDVFVTDITIQDGKGYRYTLNPSMTNIKVVEPEEVDIINEEFTISPNPTSSNIEIILPLGAETVLLTDILGRTLINKSLTSTEKENATLVLDLNNVDQGLYHITVYAENDLLHTKALQVIK